MVFVETGVGAINSVIGLGNQIHALPEGPVILLGTAGIMGKAFVPGEVYQARIFRRASLGLALEQGYLPESLYPDIPAAIIQHPSAGSEPLSVFTTPEITASEACARALTSRYGPGLENLEAYGLARLLQNKGRFLSAFFSVTNQVGPESHFQYLRYRQLAWETLARKVYDILEGFPYRPAIEGLDHE